MPLLSSTTGSACHHTQKPIILRQGTYLADLAGHQMLPLEPRFVDSQHQPTATSNLHSTSFTSIGDWLRFQSKQSACQPAFTVVDATGTETYSWTWERLWTRADKICRALLGKSHLAQGDRVGLVYRKSEVLDFLAALYGCLLAGMTAVPVNVIGQLEDMIQVIQETQMGLVLTTEINYRVLMTDQQKRKTQQNEKKEKMLEWPTQVVWWKTDTLRRRRFQRKTDTTSEVEEPRVMPDLAYIEYTKTASGELRGVAVSHKTVLAQCRILALSLGSILERRGTALVQEGEERRTPPFSSLSSTSTTSNTTVLSWLEPRQQVGLVLGGLLGVHQGHHTVFVHQDIAKAPSIWQTCLARYMTDVALGEYDGISEMLKSRGIWSACSPATTQGVSSNLKAFLIDTLSANPTLNERLATEVLGDMGVSEPHDAVFPMVSLAEHGGMVLSVRDYLTSPGGNIGPIQDKMVEKPESLFDGTKEMQVREKDGNKNMFVYQGYPTYSHTVCRYLLDRHSLKHNLIKVVATGDEAVSRATELGVMLVEAFGYATPQATLAVVDSETTALCSPGHVGEIWVDSPSIAFGFWGMHKQSQATFHALPLLVNTVTMAAEVYDPVPAGFLRTNLLGGVVEGRLVVFGRCDEQIHQSVHIEGSGADCNGEIATETVGEGSEKEENSMDITVLEVYYASDLAATILERIVGFTACVVFDFFINNEVLPIVCAETSRTQRADLEMLAEYARQAMQDYHGLRPYCIAIAPQGSLPRGVRNGRKCVLHIVCQHLFEQGGLPLIHTLTSVEDTISDQSLDCGDDRQNGIWGTDAVTARAARRQAHERVAQFSSCSYPRERVDERIKVDLAQLPSLPDVLVWRSIAHPNDIAFIGTDFSTSLATSIYPSSSNIPDIFGSVTPTTSTSFHKFGKKVVNIAKHIEKRGGFCAGDRVVLLFSNSVEFVATLYACWFLGLVPVPVQLPEPARALEEMLLLIGLLKELKISYVPILGDSMAEELLKHRAMRMHLKAHVGARQDVAVPTVLNVSQAPKMHKPLGKESRFMGLPKINASHLLSVVRVGMVTTDAVVEPIALISIHYSADMRRTLVNVSHANLMAQCRAQKVQCRFGTPNAPVVSCWNTFSGLGTVYSSGIGVFSGVPTVLLRYSDFLTMPQMYLEALERYQAVNALLSADMLNRVTTLDMTTGIDRTYNLSQLRNIVFDVDYRLDPAQKAKIEQRFMHVARKPAFTVASTRLDEAFSNTHISLTFGHAFNPMITSRSYMNVEPVRLYLSLKSLRRGIVKITTEDEDPHGIWVEDCGIPVSGVTVAIVNPETREVCMSGEIGEIWVSSEANVQPFPTISTKSRSLVTEPKSAPPSLPSLASLPLEHSTSNWSSSPASFNSERRHSTRPSAVSSMPVAPPSQSVAAPGSTIAEELHNKQFHATLVGDQEFIASACGPTFVRTGEVGFLWSYAHQDFNGGCATSLLYLLGAIGETLEVNGLMHFAKDVENTIEQAHENIAPGGSVVFPADRAVVFVVQVRYAADPALANLALSVMHRVMEVHQFVPDVIAVVDDTVIPRSRSKPGIKMRGKMLSLFMSAKMPLLYVHYPHGPMAYPCTDRRKGSVASSLTGDSSFQSPLDDPLLEPEGPSSVRSNLIHVSSCTSSASTTMSSSISVADPVQDKSLKASHSQLLSVNTNTCPAVASEGTCSQPVSAAPSLSSSVARTPVSPISPRTPSTPLTPPERMKGGSVFDHREIAVEYTEVAFGI